MPCSGRSLPELLLVIALLAVLAGGGARWAALVDDQRQASIALDLFTALQTARNTAIHRRQPVTLCPLREDRCRHDWPGGWALFADRNADGRRDADEAVLQVWGALPPGSALLWRSFRNQAGLTFTARGWTAHQNGHFLLCPPDRAARRARQLVVNRQGRVRMARDTDGDGLAEDAQGQPLACPD